MFNSFFTSKILKREPQSDGKNEIVWPKKYIYVTIAFSAAFGLLYLFLLLLMIFAPERIADFDEFTILQFSIIFIPIILGLIIFTLYLAKFKIIVEKDCFIYQNLFKRTKTYSYDNVYSTFIGSSYRFYQNDKLIVKVSLLQDNCDLLDKRITAYQRKNKIVLKDKYNGVIKRTKMWIIISLCYSAVIGLFNAIFAEYYWWWYYTLLLHLPNLLFILSCLLWKITFKDGVLIKRSLFSWNKRYNVEELTYDLNDNMWLYKIYRGKKRIAFVLAIEYDSRLIETNLKG